MTPDELQKLPVTVNLLTAAKALGISKSLAYELAAENKFPCKVLRAGTRYRVVTRGPDGLLATCGVGPEVPATGAA